MSESAKKNKRELIYEEAAKLFKEKGYAASSMRELAKRVGLKASSFYNHIASKEDILRDICFESAHKFLAGMDQVKASFHTPLDQLRALIRLHISIASENVHSIIVFNDEWKHLSEPYLTDFLQMRSDYESQFLDIIKKGIETGDFQPLDPKISLFTILNALKWVYFWMKPERKTDVILLQDNLEKLLLEGLGK